MRLKWWGWGYEGEEVPKERVLKIIKNASFLIDENYYFPPKKLEEIEIPEPKIEVKKFNVKSDKYERVLHAVGRSYKDLIKVRYGEDLKPPDVVFYPESEKDIFEFLEFCYKKKIAVIPFSGGTSVVGGVEPDIPYGYNGVATINLTKFSKILKIDEKSLTAEIEAGIRGPAIESELRKFGLSLRHYPQSHYLSTLGGWIATRSAGHYSTVKIEDLVQSIKVITPKGFIETFNVPASAVGPDIKRFFVGSEGILGIITSAVVKLHRFPIKKLATSLVFPNFESGIECLREIVQRGINPAVIRLMNEEESMVSSLMGGGEYLGPMMVISFEITDEEDEELVKSMYFATLKISKKFGGREIGKEKFDEWKKNYYEQPYMRDVLMDFCLIVDTLETATYWSNIMNLYNKVKSAIDNTIFELGFPGISMCRITHVYPSGASLYFSFITRGVRGEEIDRWWRIKKVASDAIIENGGTITHHHAVGRDHKEWAKKEIGKALNILKKLKKSIDPKQILNPGVLI